MSHLPMLGAREAGRLRTDDYHQTPECATEALLSVEQFQGAIWEPACGEGAISKVLERHGHEVISTDLVDRGYGKSRVDFLMELRGLAPNIISNPPFKNASEFAIKAHDLATNKVAFLCRLGWLEGMERYETVFRPFPMARVWVFSRRLPMMHREGFSGVKSNAIAFCWFVWDKSHAGSTHLGWLR